MARTPKPRLRREVEYTDEFESWWTRLTDGEQDRATADESTKSTRRAMSAHHSPSRSPGPPAPAATPPTVSTATASTLIPVLPAAPPGCPPASSRSPRSANSTFSIRPAADVATTVRNDPRGRRRQRRPPRLARADPVSTKPNPLPRDLHGRPHPYALRVCGPSLTPLPQVATFRRIAPPRATGTAPAPPRTQRTH